MRIGALDFQPYIYNTNEISSASMNKVRAVPSDINAEKTDYSGLVGKGENENPLRPGESSNFAEIYERQMLMSDQNASRIMRTDDEVSEEVAAVNAPATAAESIENFELANSAVLGAADSAAETVNNATEEQAAFNVAASATEASNTNNNDESTNLFQMRRATSAYAMAMGF